MQILVVLAHPESGSFNHAIAREVRQALADQGHQAVVRDLYQEKFDGILPSDEIPEAAHLDPEIQEHCEALQAAHGLIFIHPNWWGQPPAILKGWLDRVLRPGVAYRFLPGDQGEGIPLGLLPLKHAVVFNTSNTPPERESGDMGDPLETLWKNCILKFCGVRNVTRRMFQLVVTSTPEERQAWLQEVRQITRSAFPKEV